MKYQVYVSGNWLHLNFNDYMDLMVVSDRVPADFTKKTIETMLTNDFTALGF